MKKLFIILSIVISIIIYNKEQKKLIIPSNSIRIRIIANSNNIEDQVIKLKVKNNVEKELYQRLGNTKNISDARKIISEDLNNINNIVKTTAKSDNFTINYGYNYFPEKNLYGVKYNEGNYESLVIKLGVAEGNNWWCVLFPPLCLLDVNKNEKNNVTYKSKVLEILKDYN